MLQRYANEKGFKNTRLYIDDGFSGTNCNRPDFKRMIADCDMHFIKTVIVKDMSRLGRNYLDTGYYTDIYFPDTGIRFIAINDAIDSNEGENDLAPFRSIMNDMYARDISKKIRSSQRIRGNMGVPLSQPPYGYAKDPENPKRWVVDEEAAGNVRWIFKMNAEGKGNETISRILQENKVLIPMAYWQSKGLGRGGKKTQPNPYKWCKTTVEKILTQQEYCGDVINFKTYSKSLKVKKRLEAPKDKWAIFTDVHEAIIDRDTFEQTQKLIGKARRRQPLDKTKERNIFSDLLYCGDCGSRMWHHVRHNKNDQYFFSCSNYVGERGSCPSTHYVRADSLEIVIRSELKRLVGYLTSDEEAFAEMLRVKSDKNACNEKKRLESELQKATARDNEVTRLYEKLYEDNVNQKVTDEWFLQLSTRYTEEHTLLTTKTAEIKGKLLRLESQNQDKAKFISAVRKFMEMETLTAPLLKELIEKIEVFPIQGTGKNRTQRLVVHYRFIGVISLPEEDADNFTLNSRKGVAVEYQTGEAT